MTLDQLSKKQTDLASEIKRIIVNYKKDPASRKTLDYLQKRVSKLDEQWDQFDEIDNKIRTDHGTELDHAYFTTNYYENVREGYEVARFDMLAKIEELKALPPPLGPEGGINPIDSLMEAPKASNVNLLTEALVTNSTIPQNGKEDSNAMKHTSKAQTNTKPQLAPRIQNSNSVENSTGAILKGTRHSDSNAHIQSPGLIRKQHTTLQMLQRVLANLTIDGRSDQYLQIKTQAINRYLEQVQELHQVIWSDYDDPAALGYDVELYFTLEEEAQNKIIKLHEHLNCSNRPLQQAAIAHPAQIATSVMKLPKITMPKFDGDYLKWRQFCDLFTELVDNQPIADCQKMWYLKTSLSGEAERLVKHLTTSDVNYAAAWKIIKDRYENSRLLVSAFLNKLLSQPTITNENASAIKGLHDTTQECLFGLQNLGINISHWDSILLHLLTKRLDKQTHTLYEQSLKEPRKLQSLKEFLNFLELRFQSLEALGNKGRSLADADRKSRNYISAASNEVTCTFCKANHKLFACQDFLRLTPSKKLEHVRKARVCFNCLAPGHTPNNCTSRTCTKCGKKHNTLLHMESSIIKKHPLSQMNNSSSVVPNFAPQKATHAAINDITPLHTSLTTNDSTRRSSYVLLSTVIVTLSNNNGISTQCRAVLDSGSQLNFITERVAKRLKLQEKNDRIAIEGIGQKRQGSQKRVSIRLQSQTSAYNVRLEAHVLPQIISPQPAQILDISSWPIPSNINLADKQFNRPGPIDLLIGAELYYTLLSVGQIKLGNGLPTLQNTVFGWTVCGRVANHPSREAVCGVCTEDESLDHQMERFWILEEAEKKGNLTTAERKCETHFTQTVKRDSCGRFIVQLPFEGDPDTLGESKDIAYQRLLSLERKLAKNSNLRLQYMQFMEEYYRLGHMEEVNFSNIHPPYYFLPHHSVVKPDSSSTKLRVVFDGSAKTSTNVSLNDILATGPTIQDDVFSILLRFRMPRFVFTADIEKMYRQVNVDVADRKYQLIWWRNHPDQQARCYQLTTVTYGTTSAPYLATKCLQRLADDHCEQYPLGSEVLKRDFYVDDVLSGSNSLLTAIDIQHQLRAVLQMAGFKLRKWCANHPRLLVNIPMEDREIQLNFDKETEEHIKTVGLTWLPKTDEFCVNTSFEEHRRVTKRTAYSDIARLFDPLGIMAPVIVTAKIFLQRLWSLKLDWDAALPQDLHTSWLHYRIGLKSLNHIKFPRHVFAHRIAKNTQVHIFADASEKAYGAVAYVRSTDKNNLVTVRLLCAKSRVAPLKSITLPRLELCAAKLASELALRLKTDLNLRNETIHLWSDSQIVLAWINSPSSSFHTFVANRVSRIQEITVPVQWRHVSSKDNPADILSRGIAPEKLASSNLWFYGPIFLHGSETLWPAPYMNGHTHYEVEKKRIALPTIHVDSCHFIEKIDHKNSFRKLQRIIAYLLRFINTTRKTREHHSHMATLTCAELDEALIIIIKFLQGKCFSKEINSLRQLGEVDKNSSLNDLATFLDDKGLIRVGGRLNSSTLPYDAKHQILLPYDHQFTNLLLNDLHKENHHVGPQTLISIVRQKFWPLKVKTIARSVVHRCTQCVRANPKMLTQLMGNLPADRVQPARPFANSGVDFCGPIWTHFKVRGKRPQKSYIAVFCCFATKATHLELVSDLTTDGFIGALKRFMARRGHCRNIYCDNGTNFVGARNQLEEIKKMLDSTQDREKIAISCSSKGTDFHFIPPRAPHFGGLWEAAVKSAKHLLQKTTASASLTYEELETVIVEIEAILNSRPITPTTSNPNDYTALTPGHFLIGEPLTSSIDTAAKPQNVNLLTRWKLVSHLKQEFWRRWSGEYLNQLQCRHKWNRRCENVQLGTMVIIKNTNLPPLRWKLGRVINVIKGEDGLVRVADIRTTDESGKVSVIRRAIHALAPLPMEGHSTQEPPHCTDRKEVSDDTASSIQKSPNQVAHNDNVAVGHMTSQDSPSNARKRQRLSLGSTIVSLLLACLILPMGRATPVQIETFSSYPGIYFENLGLANLISSEWTLLAYYDMQPFWAEFRALKGYNQAITKICDLLIYTNSCEKTVTHFHHFIKELEVNNDLLQPIKRSRAKRGAVNFVGNIANALFGVLDSQYAENMATIISEIHGNEDHLVSLLKNQTSVIDATINVINRDQQTINAQFLRWNEHVNNITAEINNMREELYQERLTSLYFAITLQAMLTASNFQRIQGSILDALADTHHGKVSPQLITPQQMKLELAKVKHHLPSLLRLPTTNDDILQLYNLMTIEGRPTERYIIFKLNVPLLDLEDFELFSVIPVPVLLNDSFFAINPSHPYLVVNLHRDQYYALEKYELQSCLSTSTERYICKQAHPIHRKGSSISECEINFLNQKPHTSSCQIIKVGDGPHWIQLHHPNQWIFALKHKTVINAVCGNSTTQISIEGSGILNLQGDCIIKQELITIRGHNTLQTTSQWSYTPLGNLTDMKTLDQPNNIPLSTVIYKPQREQLDTLKRHIQEIYNELPEKFAYKDIHHFTFGSITLILVTAVIIYLVWKCKPRFPKAWSKSTSGCKGANEQISPDPNAFDISFDV